MRVRMARRLLWLSVLVLLMLAGLGGRLYYLQIHQNAAATSEALAQRRLSLEVAGGRGHIYDRNGGDLADPQPGWGVAIFPPLVQDAGAVATSLARTLQMDEAKVTAAMSSAQARSPFWLQRQVTQGAAAAVASLGLPGVAVGPLEERFGEDALARHLVGYTGTDGGKYGLERAFESDLDGEAVPALAAYLDGRGRPMAGLGIAAVMPGRGKAPYDLYTTIDVKVQRAVERVLDQHRAPGGGPLRAAAVVVQPATGEVLALASRPQFRYTDLGGPAGDSTYLWNRAITAYEPGSTFKALVAAAALESGKVDLDDKFYCPGHYEVGDHRFQDNEGTAHGWITFGEAIARSCNVTFLQVGYEKLGLEALQEAAFHFGFGQPTGALGRPWAEEQVGAVPGPTDPGAVQISFGQGGTEVTPLQLARAYAAIANGGMLPALRLVKAMKNPAGEVVERPAAGKAERVISRETAAQLAKALQGVTNPKGNGTGRQAWLSEGGSAGKTGSAEGRTLDGHKATHAWFAGFFPTVRPRYVVVVLVEGGGGGGAVAAPIFREIGEAILATEGW